MKRKTILCMCLTLLGLSLPLAEASAQLSSNTDKFLGNITTRYNVDAGGGVAPFYQLWNQITCENESKWGSVEGTRNSYNWGCDRAFNYAKQHGFTYKFHALVWGAQYPGWLESLPVNDRYNAVVKWYNAVKNKYATLPLIDVVNEAVGNHQAGNPMMKASLGGGGKTGYDWLIKAFEMAYERWPDAILIYNDYNTFQWNTDEYIDLVRTLRDAGAPIDAYGCQSHDLTDCDFNKFKTSETKIQNALKMPMYSTEYDIGTADDNLQLQRYKEQIPYMWEKDYCAGITLWGYIYGATWTTDGNSGLFKNGKERPAMTWLREYMQSDTAKTAKSPFPGMKKEASIYVRPAALKVAKGDVLPIKVRARLATKTIEKVDLYVGAGLTNMDLIATMTEDPYITEYQTAQNTSAGWKYLKAVVTATDGSTYERLSRFNVLSVTTRREPYNEAPAELPGTIVVGEYDKGASGVAYNNATRTTTSATRDDAWMEYTVDVKEDGVYAFDAEVASTKSGGMFHLAEYSMDNLAYLSEFVEVPVTGSNSDFQQLHCVMTEPLTAGRHVICLNIDKGGFYIKSLTFRRYEQDKNITVTVNSVRPGTITVGDTTTISITARSTTSTIADVKVYANNLHIGTLTESPYTMEWAPKEKGTYTITAIATNAEGKENVSAKKTLKVNGKRTPYSGSPIALPGTVQAENFDRGGEGMTFHDTDDNREGDAASYRTDGGIDIVKGNNGYAIGYTAANEWMEYTVDVKEPGEYSYDAYASSGVTGSGFTIGLVSGSSVINLAKVNVAQTGSNDWGTYKAFSGKLSRHLNAGKQILRITITGANCNIDKIVFKCTLSDGIDDVEQPAANVKRPTFNLSGQRVDGNYRGLIIRDGKKIMHR
ncbi:MAG: endo-1,4-beta-xylanase [Prevotella sp.]|nr:endo-1,4-beta-xylanase [Prevotella sp.]